MRWLYFTLGLCVLAALNAGIAVLLGSPVALNADVLALGFADAIVSLGWWEISGALARRTGDAS